MELTPCDKTQLFGKISTLLCYDLHKKCDFFHSTRGKVLTPQNFEDYLITIGKTNGTVTDVILVELAGNRQISVTELLEILDISFKVDNVKHFTYIDSDETSVISSRFISVNGSKDEQLVNDSNLTKIHPKAFTLISSLITHNSKAWMAENQIDENFYSIEVTDDQERNVKLKDFLEFEPISNPIYEDTQLNFYNALDLSEIGHLTNNDLGLFLVRDMYDPDGDRPNTMKNVETDFEKLSPTTMFFINDIATFEEVCKINENVHEVIFEHEYTLMHWFRSSKDVSVLRKYLMEYLVEKQKDAKEYALKIIHGKETCGKSSMLRKICRETKSNDFSKWVCLLDGPILEKVFEDEDEDIERVLSRMLKVKTKVERAVFSKSILIDGKITLLLDDVDSLPKKAFQNALKFILSIQKNYPTIQMFVTARDPLRNLLEKNCGIISHEIPELTEEQQTSLLKKLLPPLSVDKIRELEITVQKANRVFIENSDDEIVCSFRENPFNLFLVAEMYKDDWLEGSYTKMTIYENYLDSNDLNSEDFEKLAYYIFCETEPEMDDVEFPKTERSIDRYLNRSIVGFLVAKHFLRHPEELTPDLRGLNCMKSIVDIFDRKIFESFPIMELVLNNNWREIEKLTIDDKIFDCLNRNPFHLIRDNPKMAKVFLNSNYDVNHKDFFGWTPLRYADQYKDLRMMNFYLENGGREEDLVKINTSPVDYVQRLFPKVFNEHCVTLSLYILNNRSDFTVTPYHVFCAATCLDTSDCDKIALLNVMASQLPNKNVVHLTQWYKTALHSALEAKDLDLVKCLIENFDMKFENGEDELIKDLKILKYCIEESRLSESQKNAIFFRACQEGQLEIVKYFIEENKINIYLRDDSGMNAMDHVVYTNKNIETVTFLYDAGFNDFKTLRNDNCSSLHFACMGGNLDIIKFLVHHGGDVNVLYQNKHPIDFVFKNDSMETIDFLMDNGSPMMLTDSVFSMIACNPLEYIKTFDAKYKIDWNSRHENNTILQYFIIYGDDLEVLKYIVEHSKDEVIEDKTNNNETALQMAFRYNRKDMILNVLQFCCDLNVITDSGENCMYLALSSSASFDLPEFLISKGFNINVKNNKGQTPFHNLFYNPSEEVAVRSIEAGLKVNEQDDEGKTALHYAVQTNVYSMLNRIKYCLNDLGVDPSICDNRRRLALHYAVELDQVVVLEIFARYSYLDLNAEDDEKRTPLTIAETLGGDVWKFMKKFDSVQL